MTKQGHIITALATALVFNFDPLTTMFASILPDKDILIEKSVKPTKKTLFNSHRGITHHFFLIPLFLAISFAIKDINTHYFFLASFLFGYAIHLLSDIITPLGLPYLLSYYPRISLNLFKTGSKAEYILITLLTIFIAYYTYTHINLIPSYLDNYVDLIDFLIKNHLTILQKSL